MPLNFSKRQWCTLLIMGLADFCNAICVSLQAPFFPAEAEKKGAVATEYGLVFGIFELIVFLVSPIYGQYLNRIGPKVLFNGGIFTTGTSAILFGMLDHVPGHFAFISLAFTIRIVEALGNAAFLTASFAIIAKEFPNNVATTFASLETCFGLGLIVGPMLGGALYTLGGYYLPFVVLGSALFITALLTLCVLPKHPGDDDKSDKQLSMMTVLKIPGVLVSSLAISATSASIGFISATLEPHLRQFNLSPILLGMIFVINGGVYALTAPIYGWIIDKCLNPKIATISGSILISIGFCLIGPASFLPLKTTLTMAIIGLVFHGLGIAAVLVSSFSDALKTSVDHGLPDNIETYGLISGLWTSTFAFGAFVGPSVSGLLFDSVGFRGSTCFIIGLHIVVGLITLFFVICMYKKWKHESKKSFEEVSDSESLIGTDKTAEDSPEESQNESGVIENFVPIPCGMANNLLTCNSYNNKTHNFASAYRLEGGSSLNLGLGFKQSYGSIDVHHPAPHPSVHRDYETIS